MEVLRDRQLGGRVLVVSPVLTVDVPRETGRADGRMHRRLFRLGERTARIRGVVKPGAVRRNTTLEERIGLVESALLRVPVGGLYVQGEKGSGFSLDIAGRLSSSSLAMSLS